MQEADHRPDPDELLREVKKFAPHSDGRGHLKIFFGYAAGVGKTYAMLKAAHAAASAGTEVLIGYVEPHTRPATMALMEGLEILPPLLLCYKGMTLQELDLDNALRRRPQLLLVDELAHTNGPGCRHRKRYQDVEELLRAGIDIYTTVNVQHIESLNDIVTTITGVVIQERVPDSVFDSADQVKLVDLEPEELLQRLSEGKIYASGQAERAMEHFFTRENLVALREISLRRTADRVNLISERDRSISNGRSGREHILTCLSSSPSNAKVIRTAARMAEAFHGNFTALFVETPDTADLNGENRARLRKNLRLAEQLGARIATVYGEDPAVQIADYARESAISKIVLGRSGGQKNFWGRATLVERLTALAPNLDVYIIPDTGAPYRSPIFSFTGEKLSFKDVLRTGLILVITTLAALLFRQFGFSEANIVTIFILGVLFVSTCTHCWGYGASASLIGVLIFNFLFTEPFMTLKFNDKGYYITFLVMFASSFITSMLTTRIRNQARQAASRAYHTEILLETSQKLQHADTKTQIFSAMGDQLTRLLHRTVILYSVDRDSKLGKATVFPAPGCEDTSQYLCPDEQAAAYWVAKNNKHAGATTDTLPCSKCLYLAVRGQNAVFAVAGIAIFPAGGALEIFEKNLMIAMLGEFGLAVEKMQVAFEKQQISMEAKQERLRANLLRAISHDLRTPLTNISGSAGILMADRNMLEETKKQELYTNIYDDSMWLINLVENLLAVTRIENDTLNIRTEPELISDIVEEALAHVDRRICEHRLNVELTDDLLMARMDARLMIQVLINLVDNAVKYTPAGSLINVKAYSVQKTAVIEVADNGPGISDEAKSHLFDIFYTVENKKRADGRRGLGLGLSLCRSIINAHGGTISVRDNIPTGTIFSLTLPAEEVTYHE